MGEWREAKGCRFYMIVEDRTVQMLSWHQVHTDEAAAEALRQIKAAGLMPEAEARLCVIADVARGLWKQAQALFPSAVEIVDDYHGSEHVHQVAALPYGAHPERQQPWGEAALARLCYGEAPGVIWGLQRLQPTEAQAAREIDTLSRSRQRPQERLDSRVARTGGYPMGSGGIASANTCICHVRLKRSGAWWDGDQCQSAAGPALRPRHWHLRPGLCPLPLPPPRPVRVNDSQKPGNALKMRLFKIGPTETGQA